jgi:hypothetical protein
MKTLLLIDFGGLAGLVGREVRRLITQLMVGQELPVVK